MPCVVACAPRNRAAARKQPSAEANGSRARRKCCSQSPAKSRQRKRKWRGNPRVLLVGGRPDKFYIHRFSFSVLQRVRGRPFFGSIETLRTVLASRGIGGEGETAIRCTSWRTESVGWRGTGAAGPARHWLHEWPRAGRFRSYGCRVPARPC